MNRHIKRLIGKIWVLENEEAIRINQREFERVINEIIVQTRKSNSSQKVSRLSFNSLDALKLNKQLVSQLDDRIIVSFIKEIKKFTIFRLYNLEKEEIKSYFEAVIDLFTKPLFLKSLRFQMKNKRHIHGLSGAILKHIFSVSLFSYIYGGKDSKIFARIGLLHDLTVKEDYNNYTADSSHPVTASIIAERLNEPKEVILAIKEHLFCDIIKLARIPKSSISKRFIFYDTIIAIQERLISIVLKIKQLF